MARRVLLRTHVLWWGIQKASYVTQYLVVPCAPATLGFWLVPDLLHCGAVPLLASSFPRKAAMDRQ